jgi:hypothetical protein
MATCNELIQMNSIDPFGQPMVFLRIGWMDRYQGKTGGDNISSGGAYVAEHGFGHEIFNFQPFNGRVYGYVQPPGRKNQWQEAQISLERLGGSRADEFIRGVLVLWVATTPFGGASVVGWYRNATVYRRWQPAPPGSDRKHGDVECGYYVVGDAADAALLPPDKRIVSVPQQGKGAFGQANVWYADDPAVHRQLRLNMLRLVQTGDVPSSLETPVMPRQTDLLTRQRVEKAAVEIVGAHFTSLGYSIRSVERDNVGWDLDATYGQHHLRVEVKGLSGAQISVELTPNEYAALRRFQHSYRLAVVTNALIAPALTVFAYSPDSGRWESTDRRTLTISEIVAAHCSGN